MMRKNWQIKVSLNPNIDRETFAEVKEKVSQGIPASTAIKIMLAERDALRKEIETLREALTLAGHLSGTFEGPLRDPQVLQSGPDRPRTDDANKEIFDLMEGFGV